MKIEISDDTKEVACMTTGYVVKKLSERNACDLCKIKIIANKKSIKVDEYLANIQFLGVLDYVSQLIHNIMQKVSVRNIAKEVLIFFFKQTALVLHV